MKKYHIYMGKRNKETFERLVDKLKELGYRWEGRTDVQYCSGYAVLQVNWFNDGRITRSLVNFVRSDIVDVLLADLVIDGEHDAELRYVTKDTPPYGYRLVTEEEKETKKKPPIGEHLLAWRKIGKKWDVSDATYWLKELTYAVRKDYPLKDYPLESKAVEMTVEEIQEKLGHKVKVVEG